jgi:hypothetical protein
MTLLCLCLFCSLQSTYIGATKSPLPFFLFEGNNSGFPCLVFSPRKPAIAIAQVVWHVVADLVETKEYIIGGGAYLPPTSKRDVTTIPCLLLLIQTNSASVKACLSWTCGLESKFDAALIHVLLASLQRTSI